MSQHSSQYPPSKTDRRTIRLPQCKNCMPWTLSKYLLFVHYVIVCLEICGGFQGRGQEACVWGSDESGSYFICFCESEPSYNVDLMHTLFNCIQVVGVRDLYYSRYNVGFWEDVRRLFIDHEDFSHYGSAYKELLRQIQTKQLKSHYENVVVEAIDKFGCIVDEKCKYVAGVVL